jgi:hypothetical protein
MTKGGDPSRLNVYDHVPFNFCTMTKLEGGCSPQSMQLVQCAIVCTFASVLVLITLAF